MVLRYLQIGKCVFVADMTQTGAANVSGADIKVGDQVISVNGLTAPADMVEELQAWRLYDIGGGLARGAMACAMAMACAALMAHADMAS